MLSEQELEQIIVGSQPKKPKRSSVLVEQRSKNSRENFLRNKEKIVEMLQFRGIVFVAKMFGFDERTLRRHLGITPKPTTKVYY